MRQFKLGIIILVVLSLLFALSFVAIQISRTSTGQNPVASFTYSPDMPTPTETITFDASSSFSPNGAIVTYAWDFGDGYSAVLTSPTTTHSYPLDGNYTVQLIVTDNVGLTAATAAVVQVNCVQFFRVTQPDMLTPVANVVVTVYTNETGTWAKAPVSGSYFEIKYDNMTQPKLASTSAQKYRNPGYTASILLENASNIGFDSHKGSYYVYFSFSIGVLTAKWPNNTSLVYSYKNGHVETHNYLSGHGAVWDAAAGTYVIKVENIARQEVEPTQDHPIIVSLPFPQNTQQYYLTVKTDPMGIVSIPGQGFYSNGTSTSLTAPSYVNVSSSSRYRFNNWDVDGTSQGSTNPITVSMNGNHTATAHYVLQYLVTFGQTGLLSGATGTVVTVNGGAQGYSNLPFTMCVDNGASVTYSYNSIVASSVSGQQFRLNSISGPASPITVTSAATVTGTYVTQYLITFAQTGLDGTATGTVVTVNGNAKVYSNLPFGLWVDCGSSVTYSYGSIVSSSVSGKQFRLSSSTGPSSPISVAGPATITGNYVVQYLVTFAQTGLDSTASGTIVTVNSNAKVYSTLPYVFWVDTGTSVTYSYGSIVSSSVSGKQFRLSSVTGPSSPITVTATQTITGNYVAQYQLAFSQTGLDSTATGIVLAVNSYTKTYGDLTYTMWADSGSSVAYSYGSIVTSSVSGKQFKLNTFSGPSSPFTVTGPSSMTGSYKTQYYLTVTSVYDSPSPVSGWFDSGSSITESVTSPVSGGSGVQYVCTGWTGTGSVPVSGSGSSVMFTINAASSVAWGWKTQYYLTVTSVYDSPSPVSGWFDSGSSITESVTSPVSGGSGVQYVCTGWTGTGSVPVSGSGSSVTFSIVSPSSIMWNWKTQYTVTFSDAGLDSSASGTIAVVNGVPVSFGQLPYSVWVDNGASVTYSYGNVSSSNSGERFILLGVSGLPSPATVTGTMTVTGNYQIQYQVTFGQTGVGPDFVGTVLTVDSNTYSVSSLPVSLWFDGGSSHSYSFGSPLTVNASLQYIWSSTSGLVTSQSGSLFVSAAGSVTGTYVSQIAFQVTFDPGVGPDWTGTVLTVDGVNYTEAELPVSFLWNFNSVHIFAFQSPLVVTANDKQYLWDYTTGLSTAQSGSITVTSNGTIAGYYKTQYYLTLATNPPSVNSPIGSGWYDAGTVATVSTDAFVDITPGSARFRFNGWSTANITEISDPTRSPTNVSMDAGMTVTASYVAQYKVSFDQTGVGSDFTGTIVTVDLVDYNGSQLPVSLWLDSGSTHGFAYQSPLVVTPNSKQYAWTGTSGMSTLQSDTLTVSTSGGIIGSYKTQYYFASSSPYDSPTPANGWFDSGTSVTASVAPMAIGPINTQYVCTGWTGTGSVPSPGVVATVTFTITQPSTIAWNWKTQYYLTVMTSPGGIASLSGNGWYDSSAPVTITAPAVSGYNFTKWDVDGTPMGAGVSTIIVTMNAPHVATADYAGPPYIPPAPSSVGGDSFSLAKPAPVSYFGVYSMVTLAGAVALALKKRRRK